MVPIDNKYRYFYISVYSLKWFLFVGDLEPVFLFPNHIFRKECLSLQNCSLGWLLNIKEIAPEKENIGLVLFSSLIRSLLTFGGPLRRMRRSRFL